jgi:UV radiation resistance-associated gene protein
MATSTTAIRHDSYLLPYNRAKLRNLISLSVRNITLDSPVSPTRRRRGKTIDDDALPQTLQSPAKLVALRERESEGRGLEHSRSSSDLRREHAVVDGEDAIGNGSPVKGKQSATRPKMPGRMRRRSTLEWAHATPQRRQERLERAVEERMVDVFFSLHTVGIEGMV